MADYISKCRSNYFKVTDETRLREIIDSCQAEGNCRVEQHDNIEKDKFCFYCDYNLNGLIEDENDEDACDNAYDKMIEELQKILPDGEAIIIIEAGSEKTRYIACSSIIITKSKIYNINLKDIALNKAKELLNNPNYETQMFC